MKVLPTLMAVLAILFSAHAASARHKVRVAPPQIACTDVGCLPVPLGCTPSGGKTFDGAPTGFDVMVCPDGTRYGDL